MRRRGQTKPLWCLLSEERRWQWKQGGIPAQFELPTVADLFVCLFVCSQTLEAVEARRLTKGGTYATQKSHHDLEVRKYS